MFDCFCSCIDHQSEIRDFGRAISGRADIGLWGASPMAANVMQMLQNKKIPLMQAPNRSICYSAFFI